MIITKLKHKVNRTTTVFTEKADALGDEYARIASEKKELDKQNKDVVERIFRFTEKANRVGSRQTTYGKRWEIGRLFRATDVVNSERLKKLVGDDVWKSVTIVERRLDPVLLERAIKTGVISVKTYAKCVSKKDAAKPSIYVREIKKGKK